MISFLYLCSKAYTAFANNKRGYIKEDTPSYLNNEMSKADRKLTTEEIYSILVTASGNSNFELVNYDFEALSEKIGLLGDHAILSTAVNVFIDKESHTKNLKTYTFFVKFFPSSEMQAIFCRETGAFKKEVFVYELFEKIRSAGIKYIVDCVPRCYFSRVNYALVTENLTEKGYKLLDKMNTLNYDTLLVVLKALAKLHASSIMYEEKKSEELNKTYRLIDDYESEFEETFYNDRKGFINVEGVQASIKALCSEIDIFNIAETLESGKNFKDFLQEYSYRVYDLVKRNSKCRNVLCHGDLWATNFLVKFDKNNKPTDCKFVDFQCGRYLPPSHDVMALLYLSTNREFRQNHMYEILGLYYTNLEKYLKLSNITLNKILTIGDFLSSCEEQKFFAIFQTATYMQLVLVDNEKLRNFFDDRESNEDTAFVDRTPLILENVEGNVKYQERLKESMLDLKEFCDRL